MADDDQNSGVTGLVNLCTEEGGVLTRPSGAQAILEVVSYARQIDGPDINAAGRGDGNSPDSRVDSLGQNLILTGWEQAGSYALPNDFNEIRGTVVLKHPFGNQETFAGSIRGQSTLYDIGKDERRKITLTVRPLGYPNMSTLATGESNQPTILGAPNLPTQFGTNIYTGKELWDTTYKLIDPSDIEGEAVAHWLFYNIGDDHASEVAAVQTVYAAVSAPVTGYEQRPHRFVRRSAKYTYIDLVWGRRTTAQDLTYPRNTSHIDGGNIPLTSTATRAAVNGTPAVPAGNFVKVHAGNVQIHDYATLYTDEYGQATPQQAREFDGTVFNFDASDLTTTASQAIEYYNTNSPPANSAFTFASTVASTLGSTIVIANETIRPVTAFVNEKTLHYAKRTSKTAIEQDETSITSDPWDMLGNARITLLDGDTLASDLATIIAGTTLVQRLVTNSDLAGDHTKEVTEYGQRTTKQDVEMPLTETTADPNKIRSNASIGILYTTGSGLPGTPGAPLSELKLVDYKTDPLNNTRSSYQARFGVKDSIDDLVLPFIHANTDPTNNAAVYGIAAWNSALTQNASFYYGAQVSAVHNGALVFYDKEVRHEIPGVNGFLAYGTLALNTRQTERERSVTRVTIDLAGLTSEAVQLQQYAAGTTAPTPVTPFTNAKIVGQTTQQINNLLNEQTTHHGLLQANEAITFPGTTESYKAGMGSSNTSTAFVGCNEGDTIAGIRANNFTSFNGSANFDGFKAVRKIGTKAILQAQYLSDNKVVAPWHRNLFSTNKEHFKGVPYASGGGFVSDLTITNQGSGYANSSYTLTFNNTGTGGSGAAATAYVGLGTKIVSVVVTNGGSGYTAAPTVTGPSPEGVAGFSNITATFTANIAGINAGWNQPDTQIFISNWTTSNGYPYHLRVEPQEVLVTRGRFHVRTIHAAANATAIMSGFAPYLRTTNNAVFCGFPKNTVMYCGAMPVFQADGTTQRIVLDHAFAYEEQFVPTGSGNAGYTVPGHYITTRIPSGWIGSGILKTGNVLASTINSTYTLSWPPQSDFATGFGV